MLLCQQYRTWRLKVVYLTIIHHRAFIMASPNHICVTQAAAFRYVGTEDVESEVSAANLTKIAAKIAEKLKNSPEEIKTNNPILNLSTMESLGVTPLHVTPTENEELLATVNLPNASNASPQAQGDHGMWQRTEERTDWFKDGNNAIIGIRSALNKWVKVEILTKVITEVKIDGKVTLKEEDAPQKKETLTESEIQQAIQEASKIEEKEKQQQ